MHKRWRQAFLDSMIAKGIGRRLAIKSVLLGLVIAYLIMTALVSVDDSFWDVLLWFTDISYAMNLAVGVVGLLAAAYFFGQRAGIEIIEKKKNEYWTGIKFGLLILWTGTIIGSSVGFVKEGLDNIGTNDNPFVDYFYKPLFWVTIFGLIPVIVVGLWFGRQIKKQGLKISG
jgi:hypothetical protein